MKLGALRRLLASRNVTLTKTADGKLHFKAPGGLETEIVAVMEAHRADLLKQVDEGRTADGRLNAAELSRQSGRCASCDRWTGPDEYGLGVCPLGREAHGWFDGKVDSPVMTVALHECVAHGGKGWKRSRKS